MGNSFFEGSDSLKESSHSFLDEQETAINRKIF